MLRRRAAVAARRKASDGVVLRATYDSGFDGGNVVPSTGTNMPVRSTTQKYQGTHSVEFPGAAPGSPAPRVEHTITGMAAETDFRVSGWVYFTGLVASGGAMGFIRVGNSGMGTTLALEQLPDGAIRLVRNASFTYATGVTLATGQWHSFDVRYRGTPGAMEARLNGTTVIAETAVNLNNSAPAAVHAGTIPSAVGTYATFYVDNLKATSNGQWPT